MSLHRVLYDGDLADRFGQALLCGDAQEAEALIVAALDAGTELPTIHARVIEPALRWIGALWKRGEIGIDEERVATGIATQIAASIAPRGRVAPRSSRQTVLLATVPRERHALGLRLIADTLDGAGFRVVFLGAGIPNEALLEACLRWRPEIVGIGLTQPEGAPELREAVQQIRGLTPAPKIIVGGRAAHAATEVPGIDAVVFGADRLLPAVERLLTDQS